MGMSGGGGGSSGQVRYPPYIESAHGAMLGDGTLAFNLTDLMEIAIGGSPFELLTAFDPDAYITDMENALVVFNTLVTGMSYVTDWETMVSTVVSQLSLGLAGELGAFNAEVDNEIEINILPRFQRGMQDINAVQSSSFVLGEAYIEAEGLRQKEKYAGQVRRELMQQGIEQMLKLQVLKTETVKNYVGMLIEQRVKAIVAKKEETDVNREIDEQHARWNLGVFQHAANFIAAPGGGTLVPKGPNAFQSALGTGMSLLGTGAMVASMMIGM